MKGKRKGILLLAGGMVICMSVVLAGGIKWSQSRSEKSVVKAAAATMKEVTDIDEVPYWSGWIAGAPYREVVEDQEIVKQVCERYGLDYMTVTMGDITREMRNYEEALDLIKNMGDKPLLAEYATDKPEESAALESLEIYIGDVYAFDGGKKVIEDVCSEENINPAEAVISDLTAEQLIEIGERAFDTSDH